MLVRYWCYIYRIALILLEGSISVRDSCSGCYQTNEDARMPAPEFSLQIEYAIIMGRVFGTFFAAPKIMSSIT